MKEADANRMKFNNIYSTYEFFLSQESFNHVANFQILAVTRIRTQVTSATTKGTNHYTITTQIMGKLPFTGRTSYSVLIASAAYKAFLKNVYYLGLHRNTDRARYGTNPLSGKLTRCLVKLINPRPYFSSNVFVGNRNSYSYFKASNLNFIIIAKDHVTLNEPD